MQSWAHEPMDVPYSGQISGVGIYQFFTGVDIWKMESPERPLVWTLTPTMRSCVSVSAQECYEELYEEARRGGLLSLFGARFQSWTFHRSQLCELITICGA